MPWLRYYALKSLENKCKQGRSKTCFKTAVNNWFASLHMVRKKNKGGEGKGESPQKVKARFKNWKRTPHSIKKRIWTLYIFTKLIYLRDIIIIRLRAKRVGEFIEIRHKKI